MGNVVSKVGNLVKQYAAYNSYKAKDFQEVIHIVDTDGTYISNEKVIEKSSITDIEYTEENILCSNKSSIEIRNANKSAVIDRLISNNHVWNSIPYKVFYMSCNLDHVLYNQLNCSDEEKEENAYEFAKRYKDDIAGFVNFMILSPFSIIDGYRESWEYIKKETNSLKRNTNFGICIRKACGCNKEDTVE